MRTSVASPSPCGQLASPPVPRWSPIVGGFLLEHFYWGSVFLMALPILVPFLILAPMTVPESKDPNPARWIR